MSADALDQIEVAERSEETNSWQFKKNVFGVFSEKLGSFYFIWTIYLFFTHIPEANSHLLNPPVNLSANTVRPRPAGMLHAHCVCVVTGVSGQFCFFFF